MITSCRKSCCWTPFNGICGKQRKCSCHPQAETPRWIKREGTPL